MEDEREADGERRVHDEPRKLLPREIGHVVVHGVDRSQELRRLIEDVQPDSARVEQHPRALNNQTGQLLGLEHATQRHGNFVQGLKDAHAREVDVGRHPFANQPTAHL